MFKFRYQAHDVQLSNDIQAYILQSLADQLRRAGEAELKPYRVIDDDEARVHVLDVAEKEFSFLEIFKTQVNRVSELQPVQNLAELQPNLWASVFAFPGDDGRALYAIRKMSGGKVGADPREGPLFTKKRFNAMFNTTERRLELLTHPTVALDNEAAAFFFDDRFYIFNKAQFELIAGLEEDFAATALSAIERVAANDLIDGLDLLRTKIKTSKRMMKRLANLTAIEGLTEVTPERIQRMRKIADDFELPFKLDENGRVVIENQGDLEAIVQLLEDYFLLSPQTDYEYGSRAKTRLRRT